MARRILSWFLAICTATFPGCRSGDVPEPQLTAKTDGAQKGTSDGTSDNVIGPGSSDAQPEGADVDAGLSANERATFFHLSEGSELYPLAFLLALKNQTTGKPFLDDVERFGLIPDEQNELNPYGLPIGLTADETVDLNVQMVGVNCAACHVGKFEHDGKTALIVGAPNQLDLTMFFSELAESTLKTFQDLDETLGFIGRVYGLYHPSPMKEGPSDEEAGLAAGLGGRLAMRANLPEGLLVAPFGGEKKTEGTNIIRHFTSIDAMKAAGEFENMAASLLTQTYEEELKRPADDLGEQLGRKELPEAWSKYLQGMNSGNPAIMLTAGDELAGAEYGMAFCKLDKHEIAGLAEAAFSPTGPLAKIPSAGMRQASVIATIQNLVRTIRVLKARGKFLLGLLTAHAPASGTKPGFGRVDAFGGARNLVFPDDAKPTTAPVCWPHIWGIGQITWYHWDGSTNSLLERNVGQALGLGAVFNRKTYDSTIKVVNIMTLESLATKIKTPVWPEAAFGKIDQAKAKRGEAIFEERCASCHYPLQRIDDLEKATTQQAKRQDPLHSVSVSGTDRKRAINFAEPVGTEPFNDAIAAVLREIIKKANGTVNPTDHWRVTREYAPRPIAGIWASPPYLHNGSVPTLYDLLLPEDQRPRTFPLGHRLYDVKRLGFVTDIADARFTFDTSETGNSNDGHSGPSYGTDLIDDDRWDVLEYLKTFPPSN